MVTLRIHYHISICLFKASATLSAFDFETQVKLTAGYFQAQAVAEPQAPNSLIFSRLDAKSEAQNLGLLGYKLVSRANYVLNLRKPGH